MLWGCFWEWVVFNGNQAQRVCVRFPPPATLLHTSFLFPSSDTLPLTRSHSHTRAQFAPSDVPLAPFRDDGCSAAPVPLDRADDCRSGLASSPTAHGVFRAAQMGESPASRERGVCAPADSRLLEPVSRRCIALQPVPCYLNAASYDPRASCGGLHVCFVASCPSLLRSGLSGLDELGSFAVWSRDKRAIQHVLFERAF